MTPFSGFGCCWVKQVLQVKMNSKVRKSGWKVPQSKIYREKEECEKWPSAIQLQMASVAPSRIWASSHWFSTFTGCWIKFSVRPDSRPAMLPTIPRSLVPMLGSTDFHVTLPLHTSQASGLAGQEQLAVFSSLGAWRCVTELGSGVTQGTPCAWWDQGPRYPPGPCSLPALTCIPPQAAALAALGTLTFPSLKLKTGLRVPKISGGKHYWEQKPGGLFFRGWLLFQGVLASIFFPSTGILRY